MKLAYFDCPSGASGDMILGALVDAGLSLESLTAALAKLPLQGYRLTAREVKKGPFRAAKVDVEVDARAHHRHRTLSEIVGLLDRSGLPEPVKADARRIFSRLAEAEARVHGTRVDEVRFHDVGAVDAIVDVTGAVAGLHLLGIEAVHVSALPLGGGMVEGPHGRIPVPAPGTAELLKGFPVYDNGVKAELVTPTGAAILTTLAASSGSMPPMTLERVGYGAGSMELTIPNVLRCFVGTAATDAEGRETIAQVETTIDDMSPQLYEPLMERLLEAGALDVFLTPVIMKRSRPGVVLTALCEPSRVEELSTALFQESTTIGVRWTDYQRTRLERELVTLPTAYGPVSFKLSRLRGKLVTVTPEFSEVSRIAREKGLPVREVLDQARADARRLLDASNP
ncbi:MAG: nickel pincer cofactor biosynthesis protein LarC [Candidatus Rokubacteria bacterium]|nr:nickel pincer cofactor biosynthesis protein LarC [Candidatus Rokubacteria bacterium]